MEVLRALMDAGADLRAKSERVGHTAMHTAASTEILVFLAEQGLDPNAGTASGYTPLQGAAWGRHPAFIRTLVAIGADPHQETRQKGGLLRTAVKSGSTTPLGPAVLALLEVGVEPNAVDKDGFTALHHAALKGEAEAVEALLAHGANPVADDNELDATPLGLIQMVLDREAGSRSAWAAAGLGGVLFAQYRLNEYRRRVAPVIEMLEEAENGWSWLDAIKARLK